MSKKETNSQNLGEIYIKKPTATNRWRNARSTNRIQVELRERKTG